MTSKFTMYVVPEVRVPLNPSPSPACSTNPVRPGCHVSVSTVDVPTNENLRLFRSTWAGDLARYSLRTSEDPSGVTVTVWIAHDHPVRGPQSLGATSGAAEPLNVTDIGDSAVTAANMRRRRASVSSSAIVFASRAAHSRADTSRSIPGDRLTVIAAAPLPPGQPAAAEHVHGDEQQPRGQQPKQHRPRHVGPRRPVFRHAPIVRRHRQGGPPRAGGHRSGTGVTRGRPRGIRGHRDPELPCRIV